MSQIRCICLFISIFGKESEQFIYYLLQHKGDQAAYST